jgi:hypothetical protein
VVLVLQRDQEDLALFVEAKIVDDVAFRADHFGRVGPGEFLVEGAAPTVPRVMPKS